MVELDRYRWSGHSVIMGNYEYVPLEEYQLHSVENFIKCGDPRHGFAYLECPNCHEVVIVPFSCKSKVCNSCGEKQSLVLAEWAASEVMMNCNHKHITLTIPIGALFYFYKNGLLLKKYLQTACDTRNYIYTKSYPDKTAKVGIIAVLQTAGSKLNFIVFGIFVSHFFHVSLSA